MCWIPYMGSLRPIKTITCVGFPIWDPYRPLRRLNILYPQDGIPASYKGLHVLDPQDGILVTHIGDYMCWIPNMRSLRPIEAIKYVGSRRWDTCYPQRKLHVLDTRYGILATHIDNCMCKISKMGSLEPVEAITCVGSLRWDPFRSQRQSNIMGPH